MNRIAVRAEDAKQSLCPYGTHLEKGKSTELGNALIPLKNRRGGNASPSTRLATHSCHITILSWLSVWTRQGRSAAPSQARDADTGRAGALCPDLAFAQVSGAWKPSLVSSPSPSG